MEGNGRGLCPGVDENRLEKKKKKSDLTSEAFLSAFWRFISRRGRPICMYSDNGTTFVGAHKQLKELHDFVNSEQAQANVKHFLREQGTSWSFIPPNAPHFGGLWEGAVKSAKYHMSRVVGQAHLTFEEMSTVLYEIEAILNSRPLTPLSSDPNDLTCLTPGHFLIRQHFWQRWSIEYLHSLQERSKWKTDKRTQLKPGQLVIIKQQGLAPLQWTLARVQEVHPGSDGVTRAATVKTSKGSFLRPLSKLAILPIDT
ncbi:uncharacterized protein [Temnothorax longispinosus]|uniref:uncharacterized protein n=1 Tax=Temnothorax longispinosus TaxID=300112 RepID=UPI003A99AA57